MTVLWATAKKWARQNYISLLVLAGVLGATAAWYAVRSPSTIINEPGGSEKVLQEFPPSDDMHFKVDAFVLLSQGIPCQLITRVVQVEIKGQVWDHIYCDLGNHQYLSRPRPPSGPAEVVQVK